MADMDRPQTESFSKTGPARVGATPGQAEDGSRGASADGPSRSDAAAAPTVSHSSRQSNATENRSPIHRRRKWLMLVGVMAGLGVGGYFVIPLLIVALN